MIQGAVAISGRPGAGKSTLVGELAARLCWPLIAFDAHEQMTRREVAEIAAWLARGGNYSEIPVPGLAEALNAALSTGPALFDTPLGRADGRFADRIAFSVWLECPADVALARKIAQFRDQVPQGQEAGFVGWLGTYLSAYGEIIRPAIELQENRVRPSADISLDATLQPAELASLVLSELERRAGS